MRISDWSSDVCSSDLAGSTSGVAQWTGKFSGTWPGVTHNSGYEPGPYANEKPLFTITAANAAQYAGKLSEGEKALLSKYPKSFRMNIYPSHRDFAESARTCERAKKNRSEEHTSELQSLMRSSYAVFCWKKKT